MKKRSNPFNTGFFNKEAENQITSGIKDSKVTVRTYATDMAKQSRPFLEDPAQLYLPKIKGMFEVILQQVLQKIGAFAVLNHTPELIKALYQEEIEKLNTKKDAFLEDLRLLQKDIEGLTDISGIINKWRYKWRIVLILLTFGEVAVNFRSLLIVTPNQGVAIIASIGLSIFLFISAHSYKDVMNLFSSKPIRISIGILNVLLVVSLLFALNVIRLSYMENDGATISATSKYSFIILNFALWVAGAIIAFLYKPLKVQITKHNAFTKIKKELTTVKEELQQIENRIDAIPEEEAQKILDLDNLKSMAKHYENIISAEYLSAVADFQEHNLFARKDKVTPKAFLEQPPKLDTYFDHIHPKTTSL